MDKKLKRGNGSKGDDHNFYSIASAKLPEFKVSAKWLNKPIKATPENLDTIKDSELRNLEFGRGFPNNNSGDSRI